MVSTHESNPKHVIGRERHGNLPTLSVAWSMDCSITFAFLGNFARHSRSVRENIVDMGFHYIDEYYCNILQLQYQSHSKRRLVCLETAYSEIIRNPKSKVPPSTTVTHGDPWWQVPILQGQELETMRMACKLGREAAIQPGRLGCASFAISLAEQNWIGCTFR